jgi:diadenosine tetraphosphatase ApaH/serine/threonine PP2A family protein phosphatase
VRYLLLSDLHANAQALDAVLSDAARLGFDRAIVLGDLVGYGADPADVVARTFALAPHVVIRGNHDKVCAGLSPTWTFNDAARTSIEWTRAALGDAPLARLAALPQGPLDVDGEFAICHGAPFDEDHYIMTMPDLVRACRTSPQPVCFFGHTHVPFVYIEGGSGGPTAAGDEYRCVVPAGRAAMLNVGSVGQPRDGDPRASYGVYDASARDLRIRRVGYDVAGAQRRILEAGLPPWLAARLEFGE